MSPQIMAALDRAVETLIALRHHLGARDADAALAFLGAGEQACDEIDRAMSRAIHEALVSQLKKSESHQVRTEVDGPPSTERAGQATAETGRAAQHQRVMRREGQPLTDNERVLEHLRHIRACADQIRKDMTRVTHRLAALERSQARMRHDLYGEPAHQPRPDKDR